MAKPVHAALVFVSGKFGHEGDRGWLHRVVIADLPHREQGTVLESDAFLQGVEIWAWPIIFVCLPVDVSRLLASIAKEARLFPSVQIEGLITVDPLIHLINTYPL
jgi:hypothetical protein